METKRIGYDQTAWFVDKIVFCIVFVFVFVILSLNVFEFVWSDPWINLETKRIRN